MDSVTLTEPTSSTRDCPACQSANDGQRAADFSQGTWRLKECAQCGLVYLENPPPVSALVDEYNWTATYAGEAERRLLAQPVLSRLRKGWKDWRVQWLKSRKLEHLVNRYIKSGAVLDVGCGAGHQFARLPAAIVPHGVEIDAAAVGTAHSLASARGGRVVHADAVSGLAQFDDGSMDGIIMHSYLEHEVEPRQVLREAARVLRAGGVLIIKVPNFDCWSRKYFRGHNWPGFRFPDHVNYFTPASLRRMVLQAGMQVRKFSWLDRVPTSDNMWLVASPVPQSESPRAGWVSRAA